MIMLSNWLTSLESNLTHGHQSKLQARILSNGKRKATSKVQNYTYTAVPVRKGTVLQAVVCGIPPRVTGNTRKIATARRIYL